MDNGNLKNSKNQLLNEKRKLVYVNIEDEFIKINKKYIPEYGSLEKAMQQFIIDALVFDDSTIGDIKPEEFYMNIMVSHGTPRQIGEFYGVNSLLVAKLQKIYADNMLADKKNEQNNQNEKINQAGQAGKEQFENGVRVYANEIFNGLSLDEKLKFIGYIKQSDISMVELSEIKLPNPDCIDTTGEKIKDGDFVMMFNISNDPTGWSYEKINEEDGELFAVFEKTIRTIRTSIKTIKPEFLVLLRSGGNRYLFNNEEFGWK